MKIKRDKILYNSFISLLLWIFSAPFSYSNEIKVSILTCAPGQQLYSMYGHNAIRVQDFSLGSDLVYNYGTFDFNTPGFALKFMRGKLPYLLSTASYDDFLREYRYFQRGIIEQVLTLDSMESRNIVQFLNNNMLPENRAYKYDFFKDNCATRLRDVLETNIQNLVWDTTKQSQKTFREIIKEYQKNMPWTNFGIDLIIGAPADQKTTLREESFIPDYLSFAIDAALIKEQGFVPLYSEKNTILSYEPHKSDSNLMLSPFSLFVFLLLLEIYVFWFCASKGINHWVRKYDFMWNVLIFASSILMIFMWFGTDHIPTKYNYNLLWCNPLIVFIFFLRNKEFHVSKLLLVGIMGIFLLLSLVNAIPTFQFLQQYFHPTIILVCLILMCKVYRWSNLERKKTFIS